jgi:protein required for attachment to host cells
MNATVWILVCDAARGRLFEIRGDDPSWHLVEVLGHPESRSRASELVTDHSGHGSPEGGSVHHNALAPASSPKEVEKGHFAHALVTTLDHALRARRFHKWVLVAPPHFLGMLKNELGPELQKYLMATVDKDLTHVDAGQIAEKLRDVVRVVPDRQDDIH